MRHAALQPHVSAPESPSSGTEGNLAGVAAAAVDGDSAMSHGMRSTPLSEGILDCGRVLRPLGAPPPLVEIVIHRQVEQGTERARTLRRDSIRPCSR